jgi:hypothetical protein
MAPPEQFSSREGILLGLWKLIPVKRTVKAVILFKRIQHATTEVAE